MARETISLTILFADIAGSTRFYEMLGDRSAQRLVSESLSRLSDVAYRHRGTVVKTIGDELMCTFQDADHAVKAAKAMHQALENMPGAENSDVGRPNIYVGIHTGPVIKGGNDIFGDAVNLAARVVALAKPRQILITRQTVKALTPPHQAAVNYVDEKTVKGKSGQHKLYEYVWELEDVTLMLDRSSAPEVLPFCLELKYSDKKIKVDQSRPSITMGRQNHNDLVLNYERISRSHARIEYRRGKFVLADNSSNGTYVHLQGENDTYINREEALLYGTGVISLGRRATPGSPGAIHFAVRLMKYPG